MVVAGLSLVGQIDAGSQLQRMIATERAFAAATAEMGVRDGFLTFFTDAAIDIVPGPGGRLHLIRARDRLQSQPPARLPLVTQLLWEPRWGAIASAGDLGWLTGPYRMRSRNAGEPDRHGAYFSIWRRQPDQTFKVRLDIGISTGEPVAFPEGFTPATAPVAAPDAAARLSDTDAIRLVEARFAESASTDVGQAYRAWLLADARLHRNERGPLVGAGAASGFMSSTFTRITWAVLHAEMAVSGDLAFTVGSYDAAVKAGEGRPGSHERGFFTRVWHRDAAGAWKIAFETSGIR
jgi:ketosteroid isomerase-like protein